MDELLISPYLLAAIFFVVAAVYASVGLGGGSSYTALLAIFGASYREIPQITLAMNLVVTTIGSINYIREGHARLKLVLPFLLTSMPMAYLGGSLELSPNIFYAALLATLILVAARIYVWDEPSFDVDFSPRTAVAISIAVGAILGLVAGIVGIGGGIYLVPLIVILGLGDEKEAAATGAIFIWVNSVAGLAAHLQRHMPDPMTLLPLLAAVLVGGFIGSFLGASRFEKRTIRRVLGLVVLVAVGLLLRRLLG